MGGVNRFERKKLKSLVCILFFQKISGIKIVKQYLNVNVQQWTTYYRLMVITYLLNDFFTERPSSKNKSSVIVSRCFNKSILVVTYFYSILDRASAFQLVERKQLQFGFNIHA